MNSHGLITASTLGSTPCRTKPPVTLIPLQDLFDKEQITTPSSNLMLNMFPLQKSSYHLPSVTGNIDFKVIEISNDATLYMDCFLFIQSSFKLILNLTFLEYLIDSGNTLLYLFCM